MKSGIEIRIGIEDVYGGGVIIMVFHTLLNISSFREKMFPLIPRYYLKHIHGSHILYVTKEFNDLEV